MLKALLLSACLSLSMITSTADHKNIKNDHKQNVRNAYNCAKGTKNNILTKKTIEDIAAQKKICQKWEKNQLNLLKGSSNSILNMLESQNNN